MRDFFSRHHKDASLPKEKKKTGIKEQGDDDVSGRRRSYEKRASKINT